MAPPTNDQIAKRPKTSTAKTKNSPKSNGMIASNIFFTTIGKHSLAEQKISFIKAKGEVLTNFSAEKNATTIVHQIMLAKRPIYPRNIFLGSNAILKARKISRQSCPTVFVSPILSSFFLYSAQCFRAYWLLNTMFFIQPCSEVDKLAPLTAKREIRQVFYRLIDKSLFAIRAVNFGHIFSLF